jgi:uncharacterized protein
MTKMKKYTYIALGVVLSIMGIIGIFIPVLPTTPFLLLAAFFFSKSSERFLHWLLTNKLCGSYIDNYRSGRGLPLKQKILTVVFLWLTIGLSAFVFVDKLWVQVLLLLIAMAVTLHLMMIKTCKPDTNGVPKEQLDVQPDMES